MKKILGFMFVLITIIFSTSLMANAESITMTNKGKAVELTNAIIKSDGTYFISLDDLNAINIGYAELDEYTLLLGRLNGYYKCYVYLEDKLMDGNETYENSVITQNDIVYVSLDAIANDYSISEHTNIDNITDSISLWINDYTVDSYWLNYKVDESIEIGDEGFTVDLYYGSKRNSYISVGSGGRPLPEAMFGIDMTSYPSDSDVYHLKNTTIKNRITHTFTDENRKFTWSYDVSKRPAIKNGGLSSSSGASGSGGASSTGPIADDSSGGMTGGSVTAPMGTSVFGFIVDNEKYMGGIQSTYSNSNIATIILDSNDFCEYVTVSGTVTVPTQDKSLGFQVIAEGNRIVEKHSNGKYTIRRKHVDTYTSSIEADTTTSSYELKLAPNQDYEIYIRFANGKYVKQFIGYEDLTEDKVYNFKDFELSKTITGTIKLPDNITSLTTLDGSSVDLITGDIILQSDTPQYFIIYKTSFDLSLENKTCEFTLADDMNLGDGYIYFRLDRDYKEIYSAGVYVSNDKTEYVIDKASVVLSGTEGIVLNIANGKVIETMVDYTAENYNVGDNYILVQEDNTKLDYDNCKLYVSAERVNPEYDLDEAYCRITYRAVIPSDKTDYISCMMMFYGGYEYYLYYDKETSTWVDNFEKADILKLNCLRETFGGYKPAIAVLIDNGTLDEENMTYTADYTTIGDFDYPNSTRSIAYYAENNQLLHIESVPKDYYTSYTECETIQLDKKYYPASKKIKMFIHHNNLKPIAELTIIK